MKRSRATPALYLVTVLVIFMLLAAGISFTYFYMLSTSSTKPMLYAEVNVGSEQAGVRVGYYRSLPVWIILRVRLPEGVTTIGPTILDVMVESTILTTVKCPERKVTSKFIALCSVTIPLSMLPQGEHIIYVVVRQTKLGLKTSSDRKGEEIRVGFPTMKLNMERLSGVLHFLESLEAKFKLLLAYPPPPTIIPIYANNVDVVYAGYYSYDDLPRFYSLCDLVVNYLPEKIASCQSVKELQAMACGVPIISPSLHRDYVERLIKDVKFRKDEGLRLRAKIVEKNSYQSVASELLRLGLV